MLLGSIASMLYLGKGRRALAYLAAYTLALLIPNIGAHFFGRSFQPSLVEGLSLISVHFVGAYQSFIVSNELNGKPPLAWFARWYSIIGLIVVIPLIILLPLRTFLFEPFSGTSLNMLPGLSPRDHYLVAKYSYGYSRFSLPFNLLVIGDRVLNTPAQRGDIAAFVSPANGYSYVMRIFGIPGDHIQMKGGVLHINGEAAPRDQLADFVYTDSYGVEWSGRRFKETLPNGIAYETLDLQGNIPLDNTEIFEVPEQHYFVMGDNRDYSNDSRANREIGMIPETNLIGRVNLVFWNGETRKFKFVQNP